MHLNSDLIHYALTRLQEGWMGPGYPERPGPRPRPPQQASPGGFSEAKP